MSTPLTQIPIIDFSAFVQDDDTAQQSVAHQIYQACHEIGFMYLKNTGISSTLIQQLLTQSQHFFGLPLDVKNQLSWSSEYSNRGYIGMERERLDPNQPGDLKEAFNVGNEVAKRGIEGWQHLFFTTQKFAGVNSHFEQVVVEFYQACVELADRVCKAFALALQLPESFFVEQHTEQEYTLRLLHYPPLHQIPKLGQTRAGEHSDYGSFTLLFQDEVGGLEVCTAQSEWISAPYSPDTVIVNTGDLMQRWTNNVFCSTKHRVMIPNQAQNKRSRYSAAFFCHPNNNTNITCLETCKTPNRPPLYAPITAGDYLLERLQATY